MFSRHCNKLEVFTELFSKSDPPVIVYINEFLILNWNYSIFKSKMKSRRQGGSDANVRGLYVEELTTMPT